MNPPSLNHQACFFCISIVIHFMSKALPLSLTYRIQVLYRFVIAFILGFICTALLSLALTHLFHLVLFFLSYFLEWANSCIKLFVNRWHGYILGQGYCSDGSYLQYS